MMPPKGAKRKSMGEEADAIPEGAAPPRFELGTPVLAFHKKQLYAGKAIKRRRREDAWQYLMHYHGWGAKHDEWLAEDLLYPDTEESRSVAESLRRSVPTSAQEKQAKRDSRSGQADALAEEGEEDHLIQFIIPHTLQTHLIKEADFVREGKVVTLPRKPCVRQVLQDFIAWKSETSSDMLEVEKEMLRDMADSIISYFDKALGMMLLYKEERAQYSKWREAHASGRQSDFYGTEHLLRLVAKLPSLLQAAQMPPESAKQLHPRIMELLRYIERNASKFLMSSYNLPPLKA